LDDRRQKVRRRNEGQAWPVIGGMPYLLADGAITASHLGRLA